MEYLSLERRGFGPRSGIARANSKPARRDRFPYATLIAFANANSGRWLANVAAAIRRNYYKVSRRTFAIARCNVHARCQWQSQRTSRRRAMRVTRYARDLRPECGMAPDRTFAIDRVASRPRQTGLINPRQQPSLVPLTSSSDGQRRRRAAPANKTRRVSSVVYLRPKFRWLHSP